LLMVFVGTATSIAQAARGLDTPGRESLKGLVIPLTDMVMFSGSVGAGLYYRRRPEVHKRLMLLATIAILPGATARLPFEFVRRNGPPAYFGVADLFLVPCVLYDLYTQRRLHPATVAGCVALVASQVLRLLTARTEIWTEIAAWLTQWAL
jgi:hypothetical protein